MKKQILFLAPLNKLGNHAFRKICIDFGAEKVFSEMIRIDKILEGEEHQIQKCLIPFEMQDKTILQVISEDIENIPEGINKIVTLFPSVREINYNMGCPQSSLCKKECGGAITGNSLLVEKVSKYLFDSCSKFGIIPSIKIRLGISRENITIFENIKIFKKIGIKKIYIHGRTLKDTYSRKATFEEIAQVISENPDLEIIPNGDIFNFEDLKNVSKITNVNTFLIGRGALEDPNIFINIFKKQDFDGCGCDLQDRIEIIIKYLFYAEKYGIVISKIKSNLSYFTKNVIGGSDFRKKINILNSVEEIIEFCSNL